MQHKASWFVAALVLSIVVGALLVGFAANPAPKPQATSALMGRLDALEQENIAQQEMLDELNERVNALEELGGGTAPDAITFDQDVIIPEEWVRDESSDGILRYWHDPLWELASSEPGTMDLWLDDDTAIFFSWDWSFDLVNDLHDDEEFFHVFEEDIIWSDETVRMQKEASGQLDFIGEEAHYWEISLEELGGYSSRMLSIFYPCSDRTTCNIIFIRYDPDAEDDVAVADFGDDDWDFANTFASGVEFLTDGKATLTANANLRDCPAIDCEIVGRLVRGVIVELVAVSEDGGWYRLESGEWISSVLVLDAPQDLPVVSEDEDI